MEFWQQFGQRASVDWCEPNYLVSPYVAEWYNTLSSIVIAILALIGLFLYRRRYQGMLPRFNLGFIGMVLVGLGSTAFHGTLLRYPQASDELPMIYLGTLMLYLIIFRGKDPKFDNNILTRMRLWYGSLILYLTLFTIAYFKFQNYFVIFILTYIAIVAYIVLRSAYIVYKKHNAFFMQKLFKVSAFSYVGGVFIFWAPSQFLLPCDHWFQNIEPHAIFHLTSAIGTYGYLLFSLNDHYSVQRI